MGDKVPTKSLLSGTSSALERHNHLMQIYSNNNAATTSSSMGCGVSDRLVLERNHQFVRDDEADMKNCRAEDWGLRMARKYYDRLFKEYAIVDLSCYSSGKVGMRWRTKAEVISGKGQFTCAAKRCYRDDDLHSYEVPFRYQEQGMVKAELVKVRVCAECAKKLFYQKIKELLREKRRRKKRRTEKQLHKHENDGDDENKYYEEEDDDEFMNINPTHEAILELLANDRSFAESKANDEEEDDEAGAKAVRTLDNRNSADTDAVGVTAAPRGSKSKNKNKRTEEIKDSSYADRDNIVSSYDFSDLLL